MSVRLHAVGTRSEQEKDGRCSEQTYHAPVVCSPISASSVVSPHPPSPDQPQAITTFAVSSQNQENPSQSVLEAWQPTAAPGHEIILTPVLSEPLQMSMTQLQG